jgi:16S rRNA (guanine527-N7)-methyltransferase
LIARLEALNAPVPVVALLELHERYIQLLTKWNRTINLTSLKLEPISDEAIDRLLVEPIAASQKADNSDTNIIDLGTGGGSPAIPFWIQLPASRITMVESRSRKCAFLNEAVRQIRPGQGMALDNRFEELLEQHPQLAASADIVTVRAVRLDEPTSALIGSLLKPQGRVFHFTQELQITECSTWNKRDKKTRFKLEFRSRKS